MDGKLEPEKKSHTSPARTREQVAKMSGVGMGVVLNFTD